MTLAVTPKCTAPISMLSNFFILYECYCDRKRGKSNAIQRALVGMSCIDTLSSFAWFLSTWAVPADFGSAWSAGNQATCNFQGFLLQLAIGAPLYNCSLAMYYLLVIKYNWSNEMLHRIERWTHGAILSFSVGSAILLLPLTQYNPIGTVCWVMGSPPRCGSSSYQASDVECERGDHAYLYGMALFYGPLWVCVLACIASMVVIYFEVRKTHRRMRRYSVNGSTKRRHQVHSMRRSASDQTSVAMQAVLYSLSFFVTWTPSTVWSVAHWFNMESFALDFLSAFCEPLQGFWNALIFVRKRPSSQEKLRVLVNAVIPCVCREPGSDRDTENSGHCNHSRHRGWAHSGASGSNLRPPSSSHVNSTSQQDAEGPSSDEPMQSSEQALDPMDATSGRSVIQPSERDAPAYGSSDDSEAAPDADDECTAATSAAPDTAPAPRSSAIVRMFAPVPSRARRASHVSFAAELDGNEERGMDQQAEPSDGEVARHAAIKVWSESTSEPYVACAVEASPHEAPNFRASDATQPMHEDGDSGASYGIAADSDSFDEAQEHMSSRSSFHADRADVLVARGAIGASSTVAGSDV